MAVIQRKSKSSDPIIDIPGITRPMTYDEYLASPEEMARYDILDGWKIYRRYGVQQFTNPSRRHQEIQGNIYTALRAFAKNIRQYRALLAPCDILVSRDPSRVRQPDVLMISETRWKKNPVADDPAPMTTAPELAIEILSTSETTSSISTKLSDYKNAGVLEAWIVRSEAQTVEIVNLNSHDENSTRVHADGTASSIIIEGLTVPLQFIFES